MSETNPKLEHRIMGDYSISKSFKGILRIAHNMKEVEGQNDVFNNSTYYGNPNKLSNLNSTKNEIGVSYNTAESALSGKEPRYVSDKEYKDKKVPVTDSMGNFMNWYVGEEGTTIGSDVENQGISNKLEYIYQSGYKKAILQPRVFPVLESKCITLGLSSNLIDNEKTVKSVNSFCEIVNDNYDGMLVVSNEFDHTLRNREKIYHTGGGNFVSEKPNSLDTEQKNFPYYIYKKSEEDKDKKYRTIFKDSKDIVEKYDGFIYHQDNFDYYNYNRVLKEEDSPNVEEIDYNKNILKNNKTNTFIDCYADVENIKDYVKDIISKYMKSNVVEVPTGTVIYQYISIDKWYAANDEGSGTSLIESVSYPGHRPSMAQRNYNEPSNIWCESTVQGVSKKSNRLIASPDHFFKMENEDDEITFTGQNLKEIIPLYKRDYVLCDGSTYFLYLVERLENNFDVSYQKKFESYKRLFDLFFNIGYTYTYSTTESQDIHPFSSIKRRFYSELRTINDSSNGTSSQVSKLRFINNEFKIIDTSNSERYNDVNSGKLSEIEWSEDYVKNCNDLHNLFVIDAITMLAFNTILTEDKKVSDTKFGVTLGKYDRNKVEEWLKDIKFPEEYILNDFIYDTDETFNAYKKTTAAQIQIGSSTEKNVISLPYVPIEKIHETNADDRTVNVMIGREINSFKSLVKYYIPKSKKTFSGTQETNAASRYKTGGEYIVCEAWEIPEIQYLIDIFRHGSGVRTKILDEFFEYKFKVPNLTESTIPTFIGSHGYNWRDKDARKLNDFSKINSWSSSKTSSSIPHRHAVFRGFTGSFSDMTNVTRGYFDGNPVTQSTEQIPSSSVAYFDTSKNHRHGGKNSGAGRDVIEETGSYIFNEFNDLDNITEDYLIDNGILIKTLQRKHIETGDAMDINQNVDGVKAYMNNKNGDEHTIYDYSNNTVKEVKEKVGNGVFGTGAFKTPTTGDYRYYRDNIFNDKNEFEKSEYNYQADSFDEYEMSGRKSSFINRRFKNLKKLPDIEEVLDYNDVEEWYNFAQKYWYSFSMAEDDRYVSFEPNRCMTSDSIPVNNEEIAHYTKNSINSFNNPSQTTLYFSPENVKALPLIKL